MKTSLAMNKEPALVFLTSDILLSSHTVFEIIESLNKGNEVILVQGLLAKGLEAYNLSKKLSDNTGDKGIDSYQLSALAIENIEPSLCFGHGHFTCWPSVIYFPIDNKHFC